MKLQDITDNWNEDSTIDKTELGLESLKIPQLHNKYMKILNEERDLYFKYESEYKKLYKIKHEYYSGVLDYEELEKRQWKPQQMKILRQDIPMYLEADDDLIRLKYKVSIQEEKINYVENIIKSLNNRGFLIKNTLDWLKFQNGL